MQYYMNGKDALASSGVAGTGGRSASGARRCQALYDCDADREDELSFEEGEVIVIMKNRTDDEDWMEGMIEGDSSRRGLFPASFVRFLSD